MKEWHCDKCGMDFAAAAQPEKCPACGGMEVAPRVSPMLLSGKLKERYTCDGCDKKGTCDPADKYKCCD